MLFVIGRFPLLNVFQDVLHPAVKDFAQQVDGVGANILIFAQAGKLAVAEPVFPDQTVLGDAPFLHSGPKPVVDDHFDTALFHKFSSSYSIAKFMTIASI